MMKTSITTCLFSLGLAGSFAPLQADYASAVVSQEPLVYYRLNETGTPPKDVAANSGSLGTAAAGEYQGSVSHPVAGALAGSANGAVQASGGGVIVPYSAEVNPSGPFTVEFWVKPDQALTGTTLSCPFASILVRDSARSGWLFYQSATGWNFRVGDDAGYKGNITGAGTVTPGQWQHVVGVYDGSKIVLYVNGVETANTTVASFAPNPEIALGIGIRGDNSYAFGGAVDEAAVYSTALSAEKVMAHYANGTNASPAMAYDVLVKADGAIGYWRLGETDPAIIAPNLGTGGQPLGGKYVAGVTLGTEGLRPAAYGGFEAGNTGLTFDGTGGAVNIPPLGYTGNAMTITCWVKPNGSQASFAGLVFHRGTGTTSGLGYTEGDQIGYHWNDTGESYSFRSGLTPPGGQWSFVAMVVEPTRATFYMHDGTEMVSATNLVNHANATFGGNTSLGWDSGDTARRYVGDLDEVAIFTKALTPGEVLTQYYAAKGGVKPQILVQPSAPEGTIYTGASFSLTVGAAGTPPLTYDWTKDGTSLGAPSAATYSKGNVTTADSGVYRVVVRSTAGEVTSDPVTITVNPASKPLVSTPPQPVTRFVGGKATFSVVATGTEPLSYQWQHAGTDIPNATNATLIVATTKAEDAGEFRAVITNPIGSTTSSAATLTLITPVADSYAAGVIAAQPIGYWRMNESSGETAFDYMGGNDATHVGVTVAQAGPRPPGFAGLEADNQAGLYDGATSSTSAKDSLMNHRAQFTLVGWLKAEGDLAARTGLIGQNDAIEFGFINATTIQLWTPGGGYVDVPTTGLVTNGFWYFLSAVGDGQSIKVYLNGKLAGSGGSATTDYGSSAYPFTIGGDTFGGGVPFNGLVDEVALFDRALPGDEISTLFASAFYGSGVKPTIATHPQSQKVIVGDPFKLEVQVEGSVPLNYQWKQNGAELAGATSRTLEVASASMADSGDYVVVVSNRVGTATSQPATVQVVTTPTSVNLSDQLVAHLRFDGSYQDASARGNNGSAAGTPAFVAGQIGSQAVRVKTDNAGGVFNYVTLNTPADLDFGAEVDFTVAFWTRFPGDVPSDTPLISNNEGSGYGGQGFSLSPTHSGNGTAGGLTTWLKDDADHTSIYVTPTATLSGGWHHVAWSVTRRGEAVTYIDGAVVDRRGVSTIGSLSSGLAVNVGQDGTGGYTEPFEAEVDDLGIWRKALSNYDVRAMYLVGKNYSASFDGSGPVMLTIAQVAGQLEVGWAAGTLESAPAVTGPWTTVNGATAPAYRFTPADSAKFFRAKK